MEPTFVPESFPIVARVRVRYGKEYIEEEVISGVPSRSIAIYDPISRSRAIDWDDIHPDDQAGLRTILSP